MQRWFFLEEPKKIYRPKSPKPRPLEQKMNPREWTFSVIVPEFGSREEMFLTGNIPELGGWDWEKMVRMEYIQESNVWTTTLVIPTNCDILYRYCLCLTSDDPSKILIRKWETNLHPRILTAELTNCMTDMFGNYEGKENINRGWLTSHTLVQLKFTNNPFKLKNRLTGRVVTIKATPVKLSFYNENTAEESSLSADTTDTISPSGVFVEASTLNNDTAICQLQPQEQFGRVYKPNDMLLINMYVPDMNVLAYLIDFYSYSSHAGTDEPPYHVGYTYVLPTMLKPSEGNLELAVTCNVKHRPLGTVNIQYLIIRPMQEKLCDLRVSYAKHWDPSWTGLEVGHRGLGASFKTKEGNSIRENTIASLKKAAASGADLLEFDVQLSKDMIPVIYHDYYVCISMKRKKEVDFSEMLELPVKDLSLEHLQKLKVYHLVEGRNHEILFFDDDLEEHQPFPTLEDVLKVIDSHVGFNVELKWTMEFNDGTFELNNPFDMNAYVDKVLEVVLKHAGQRRIVFSCFNPDICTMVRNKQNKYPVMFLTVGITEKYRPYRDARCLSIPAAVQNAVSSDILGIVVHTEDLLRDPTQVKLATDAGLVMFCWGDDNNDKDTIKRLKEMGLHAVIYDKLDQYSTKEVKESIFLVETRESQRELLWLAAAEGAGGGASADGAQPVSGPSGPRAFLDLVGVRTELGALCSTVTSLESLASAVELPDDPDRSLKRSRDIIAAINKESQLKEQHKSFRGLFPPAGDGTKDTPKRLRKNETDP